MNAVKLAIAQSLGRVAVGIVAYAICEDAGLISDSFLHGVVAGFFLLALARISDAVAQSVYGAGPKYEG